MKVAATIAFLLVGLAEATSAQPLPPLTDDLLKQSGAVLHVDVKTGRMAGISDGLLDAVDEEVRRITDECYAEARRLLKENRDKLDAIVVQLLARESLDEPEIYAAAGIARAIVAPAPAPVPA